MDGGAAAKVAEYHQAYAKQCGQDFVNDYVSGVFTGAFIRRKKEFSGKTYMADFFVITGVQTRDLNISAITCPKK